MSYTQIDNLETVKNVLCCCVQCGIPLMNFREDGWGSITLFGCGHCGLAITPHNKRLCDLSKNPCLDMRNEIE